MTLTLLSTDVALHLGLSTAGGAGLTCAMGLCKHAHHRYRRYLVGTLFAAFAYFEAVVTVGLVG